MRTRNTCVHPLGGCQASVATRSSLATGASPKASTRAAGGARSGASGSHAVPTNISEAKDAALATTERMRFRRP